MTRIFTIAILDNDRFFVQGLVSILRTLLECRFDKLNIVDVTHAAEANLVFRGQLPFISQVCRSKQLGQIAKTILILEAGSSRRGPRSTCMSIQAEISRDASLQTVLREVVRVLALPASDNSTPTCPCTQTLSRREHQILGYLAAGYCAGQIARRLTLSVKTVSGYKCRAMRKLGFTRNTELYRWLLACDFYRNGDTCR